jgi:hypothetical protein
MITKKKIEEILSDVSIFQSIDVPNLNWMKQVTQKDAEQCLQKYIDLKFSTPDEIEQLDWCSSQKRQEIKKMNPRFNLSLTHNAVVEGNMMPSYFPCCPHGNLEDPLQTYFENLKSGNVYYMNSHYKVFVSETVLHEKKIIVKGESGDMENAIKPWSISTITYENGLFVHSLYRTCFREDGADKYFTILQGKEWTGGNIFDDFC